MNQAYPDYNPDSGRVGTLRLVIALLCTVNACSAEGNGKSSSGMGGLPAAAAGGWGGAAGVAGHVSGGSGYGGVWNPAGSGENSILPGEIEISDTCGSISVAAVQVEVEKEVEVEVEIVEASPVALYFMLDFSGSMDQPTPSIQTKRMLALDAINWFVNDPGSIGIDLALQYFPQMMGDCVTGAVYDTPAVPMGRLPDHAAAISASLAAGGTSNGFGTPIEGALRGATAYCARFQNDPTANPDGEQCVAVLITDGQPTFCDGVHANLARIAADAYANDGVQTFAVGMLGADFTLLELIGQAGNGDCTPDPGDPSWACDVSTGGTTFIDALNQIRNLVTTLETITDTVLEMQSVALECEWKLPQDTEDSAFDLEQVNVEFSPTGLPADRQIFGYVEDSENCGSNLGWSFDDPETPTRIVACPAACEAIQAAPDAAIDIQLGCPRMPID